MRRQPPRARSLPAAAGVRRALTAAATGLLLAGCGVGGGAATPAVPVGQQDPRAPEWLPASEPDAGTVPETPLPLPPAPTADPTASASGSPSAVASPSAAPAGRELPCDGQAGDPVSGDLDGDGTAETAVPVTCPGPDAVLVYAGSTELGNALPAEEAADVRSVEVRDGYLVVVALAGQGPGTDDDVAVTSRWRVRDSALVRTDRWLDPAYVLEIDAGE